MPISRRSTHASRMHASGAPTRFAFLGDFVGYGADPRGPWSRSSIALRRRRRRSRSRAITTRRWKRHSGYFNEPRWAAIEWARATLTEAQERFLADIAADSARWRDAASSTRRPPRPSAGTTSTAPRERDGRSTRPTPPTRSAGTCTTRSCSSRARGTDERIPPGARHADPGAQATGAGSRSSAPWASRATAIRPRRTRCSTTSAAR